MNSLVTAHNIEPTATELAVQPNERIIRLKQVVELTSLSRSTIYDRLNPKSKRYDASFPESIKLGARLNAGAVGWLESEIQAWIKQRIEERSCPLLR